MVIDTNILIAYLKAEPAVVMALSEWKQTGRALFVSSISVCEVLAFSGLTESEQDKIREFFQNFTSIPFNDVVAESAALIRRNYGLEIPDAAIAATAWLQQAPLVTRDRQFRKIKEIAIVEI